MIYRVPIDILLLAIAVGFFLRSFFRGAMKELFSLLALAAGYLASARYGGWVGEILPAMAEGPFWNQLVGRGIVFFCLWLAVGLLGRFVSRLVRAADLGSADRVGGGLIGLGKAVFVLALVILAFDLYAPGWIPGGPGKDGAQEDGSRLLPWVRRVGTVLERAIPLKEMEAHMDEVQKAIGKAGGTLREGIRSPAAQDRNPSLQDPIADIIRKNSPGR